MIKFAVCDDEINQINLIRKMIDCFFETKNIQTDIHIFTSGEDLILDSNFYDLIFMDIQMNGIDGIETAAWIRTRNKKSTFIYISNYGEKMAETFNVHPFAFLEKPVKSQELNKHLEDFLLYNDFLFHKDLITFEGQHGEITVHIQDILYFEYEENRKIRMVTENGEYYIFSSIAELSKRMEQYDFLSPHKSFIINEAKIRAFYFSLIMSNGDEIPIAKNRKKQVREQINTYLHCNLDK